MRCGMRGRPNSLSNLSLAISLYFMLFFTLVSYLPISRYCLKGERETYLELCPLSIPIHSVATDRSCGMIRMVTGRYDKTIVSKWITITNELSDTPYAIPNTVGYLTISNSR